MGAEKVEIEQDLSIQLSPNKKRAVIYKNKRKVTTPISILRVAVENESMLDGGQTLSYESWQVNIDDWQGEDYVCFHKFDDANVRVG